MAGDLAMFRKAVKMKDLVLDHTRIQGDLGVSCTYKKMGHGRFLLVEKTWGVFVGYLVGETDWEMTYSLVDILPAKEILAVTVTSSN